jgi:II/X family phage/plasmid replication protein
LNQYEEQIKLSKANDKCAKRVVSVMSDQALHDFTKGLLRFETGVKAYALKEKGIPTKLFQLIRYQQKNPNFLQNLWQQANAEFFKALEGHAMKLTDHDSVFKNLCSVYETVTPRGRTSLTKARNLFNFYCALEQLGATSMKNRYGQRQFYQNMSDLIAAGYSKAFLQNLHIESNQNIIPFVRMIEINFDQQTPDGYTQPISQFNPSNLRIA